MSELKPCPFCGKKAARQGNFGICVNDDCEMSDYWSGLEEWNTRPIEDALTARIVQLEAELAALKSENVNLSKKVTDYGKELRQSYKYDKTCSTCRYLDENRDCVLGIRCVNYTLWQGKIL